jgi:predicted TIM-barrel fold metal-dependent hydrolase
MYLLNSCKMKCALLCPDPILMSPDYAHPIGGPEKGVGFVKDWSTPEEDTEKVLWKNAVKLFKLDHLI